MHSFHEVYLDEVVETQGKLFDFVSSRFPDKNTSHFINAYMASKTRRYIDQGQAYLCTMDARDLWDYFSKTEQYSLVNGESMQGFAPSWIGEFYAYYQWYYSIPSSEVIRKVTLDYLIKAYRGLHDLDLKLAVEKVGKL